MSKIVLHTEIDTKSLLLSFAHLQVPELEEFARELNDKSFKDEELLLQINQTVLSKEKRIQYLELVQKLEQETITEEERKLCLKLAEEDEKLRNERVAFMIQLAELRGISFNQLMVDLGLQPIQHV